MFGGMEQQLLRNKLVRNWKVEKIIYNHKLRVKLKQQIIIKQMKLIEVVRMKNNITKI